MNIIDLSWNENLQHRHNHPLLPKSLRGLLIGKSGCGKTTVLMNLLLQPDWLDYNNLKIFGKSLFQPEYKIIKHAFEQRLPKEVIIRLFENRNEIMGEGIDPIKLLNELRQERGLVSGERSDTGRAPPDKLARYERRQGDMKCEFFESADDVPDPANLNKTDKNLMIFDDLQLERQNKCEAYYIRGRHSNVDCFYLAQNYFKLPRQTIRENANFICLFPQDCKNINHIYNDHVS